MIKFLRNVFLVLAVILLVTSLFPTGAFATQIQSPKLNLSHVACLGDGTLEIHFVLLNVSEGIVPGSLVYDYGTIAVGKNTGNVWHYSDYVASGYYDITSASVFVGSVEVTLHNPSEYAGEYQCPTSTPTETVTPTQVTPTEVTPTEITPTEVTPTEVTKTVTPTDITKDPTEEIINVLPLTGANTGGSSHGMFYSGLIFLGLSFIMTGLDKKLKN